MNTICPDRAVERSQAPARRTVHVAVPAVAPIEFDLHPDALWGTDAEPGMRIECVAGELWVTQAGDARDVILEPQRGFAPSRRGGRVVVQALQPSRVRVSR